MTSSEYPGATSRAVLWGTAAEGNNPFQRLAPTTVAFATRPIMESFNWSDCVAGVEAGEWYLVAFRSVLRATADVAMLTAHDDRAHTEARGAGGLLYYFKGQANEQRQCLSFCVWESRPQAQMAARLPLHRAATRIANEIYESYELERYVIKTGSRLDDAQLTVERLRYTAARDSGSTHSDR